jgi:hypothetical protein
MDAFWQAVADHDWVQPEIRQEFRLYYDAQDGRVLFYSMEDLPGEHLVIDRHTFEMHRFDIKVKDGKIIRVKHPASWKLVPADDGEYACHPRDITLIVPPTSEQKQYWKVETTHEED